MQDNEIIKALGCCCVEHACSKCHYSEHKTAMCITEIMRDALDLINRQRAEIERKDRILDSYALQYGTVADKDVLLKRARVEAVKEFCDKRGIEYVETDI